MTEEEEELSVLRQLGGAHSMSVRSIRAWRGALRRLILKGLAIQIGSGYRPTAEGDSMVLVAEVMDS